MTNRKHLTLDCRDNNHPACETCDCTCHEPLGYAYWESPGMEVEPTVGLPVQQFIDWEADGVPCPISGDLRLRLEADFAPVRVSSARLVLDGDLAMAGYSFRQSNPPW